MGPARIAVESLTPRPGIREHNRGQSGLFATASVTRKSTSVRSTRMISQHPNRHVLLTKLTAAGLICTLFYSADFLVFQVNPDVVSA